MKLSKQNEKIIICWHCNNQQLINQPKAIDQLLPLIDYFCGKCGKNYPPYYGENYFQFFELPPKLNIDLALLEQNYLHKNTLFHPDKFIQTRVRERLYAQQMTMHTNKGYEILKSKIKRAEYLLSLFDCEIVRGNHSQLLMEMMEMQEQLELTNIPVKIEKLLSNCMQMSEEIYKTLEIQLVKLQFNDASNTLDKYKYYHSFVGKAQNKLQQLNKK